MYYLDCGRRPRTYVSEMHDAWVEDYLHLLVLGRAVMVMAVQAALVACFLSSLRAWEEFPVGSAAIGGGVLVLPVVSFMITQGRRFSAHVLARSLGITFVTRLAARACNSPDLFRGTVGEVARISVGVRHNVGQLIGYG